MRLVIKICFILLLMFSLAAAAESNNFSDRYENTPSNDTPAAINEYSDGAESPAVTPETELDENSGETATEGVVEAPETELDENFGESTTEGVVEAPPAEIYEGLDRPEDESLTKTPAAEIIEHFKRDEDESSDLPFETPSEAEATSDQKPELQQPAGPQESQDKKITAKIEQ